jgi:2-polyprenyl-3-methyl-5-hydroxy-6-metoxy-1,4-benzoquinol methylase
MGVFDFLSSRSRQARDSSDREKSAPEGRSTPPATEYVWQSLASPSGTHCQFLRVDYAPLGLIDMIVDEPRLVLDVGCYCGATGAVVKERWPTATVIGIEPLAEAAEHAAQRLDRVITSTFEAVTFEDFGISRHTFDLVIFADVLEHMYNPWVALETARNLLTENGVVLASIPNIRNLGLLQDLVDGRWQYEGAGLLDVTHIRFFTLASMREMFAQTGFKVMEITHNFDPTFLRLIELKTEQEQMDIKYGSLTITNTSHADRKELATRQFYIRAMKANLSRAVPPALSSAATSAPPER